MIKRGEIYWAKLPSIEGSHIQSGVRPVLITSNDFATKYSLVVQYMPITSIIKREDLPVHVLINTNILPKKSMVLAEQEGLIDKDRLLEKIGTLSEKDMFNIDLAILTQRGINPFKIVKDIKMLQSC
jgi:mRNA interferase MazF